MYNKCIICGSSYKTLILNNLSMKKCLKCGLVWRGEFDISSNYYQAGYAEPDIKKEYARILNSESRIKTFKKYVDLNNLCDLGTGEGIFLKILSRNGYNNLIGIEPSEQTPSFCKKYNLDIKQGFLEDIKKYWNKDFHTITMFHLIEHLKNPLKSLKMIHDILQAGDSLVIETPNINSHSIKKSNYKHSLIYPEHLYYFNENNIINLLKNSGFKITAKGKRNFTQDNLGIKECLNRLGLLHKTQKEDTSRQSKQERTKPHIFHNNTITKKLIRIILNKTVILLGRVDYIWVIAKK